MPPSIQAIDQCSNSLNSPKSWVWLIFSLWYFVPLYYMPFTSLATGLLLAAYALFVGLYLWAIRTNDTHAWKVILAIVVLAAAVTPYSPGSSTFFSYIGFLIGYFFKPKIWAGLTLALVGLILALHFRFNYPFPYFAFASLSGLIAVGIIGCVERIRMEARNNLFKSHQENEQLAVIAERERIARDLHDILGHTLSSIVLKAELAEKLLAQEKQVAAKEQVSELHHIARNALSLVRQTVSGYKHRGLSGEVNHLCERLRQQGFTVELTGEVPKLSARAETALILALTELTTNVLRHSNGTRCEIRFQRQNDFTQVVMRDDGKANCLEPGNGLKGIQERVQALNGTLESSTDHGCKFVISLPSSELHEETSDAGTLRAKIPASELREATQP